MALSSLSFLAYAAAGPYPLAGLEYLDVTHLSVTVNGVPASATFDADRNEMTLAAAPASTATIVVQRTTPRRQEQRLTQFLSIPDGATLSADELETDADQLTLIEGEARDLAGSLATVAGLGEGGDLQWDAQSKRLTNVAIGSNPTDAVAKSQLDAAVAGVRNLPTVSGADNDDGLFVSSGDFAKRTPTQCRTHLALGTAAVLTAGVAANNAVQLDANARYPAADGRNIDLTNHAIQATIAKRALATVCKVTLKNSAGNGLDPSSATWSQNTTSRLNFSGGTWTSRTDLNNGAPDVNGNITPGRFDLTAGTWRIRWFTKNRSTAGNVNIGFRITNNDDTSGQTIYVDYGLVRITQAFGASTPYFVILLEEMVFASASNFSLVFRWAINTVAGNNDIDCGVFFHKISTGIAA